MNWCPCDTKNCPILALLKFRLISDNGGFEFTIVPGKVHLVSEVALRPEGADYD